MVAYSSSLVLLFCFLGAVHRKPFEGDFELSGAVMETLSPQDILAVWRKERELGPRLGPARCARFCANLSACPWRKQPQDEDWALVRVDGTSCEHFVLHSVLEPYYAARVGQVRPS